MPVSGSMAAPDQLAPPALPGTWIMPRGRWVVVPQTVMDQLVMPDHLAGRDIQTDEALAVKPVAEAVAAEIIVGRRAHGQIDVAQLLVRAHRRPNVGVAGFLPGLVLPG